MACLRVLAAPARAASRSFRRGLVLASLLVLVPTGEARAAVVTAELVVRAGDTPTGTPVAVASTRPPFVLVDGSVAFAGLLVDGDSYVFIGNEVVWRGSDAPMFMLTGTESSMGAALGGAFAYGPDVDGGDAVWTHNGLLALEGDPAPMLPAGTVSTLHIRPSMVANGTVYWLAGFNTTGGVTTEGRALYRSPNALPGGIELVMATGDLVEGLTISGPIGIDSVYDVSADDSHRIHEVFMQTGSTNNDGHIMVDGALLHQENTPNGTGDSWDEFDLVAINNAGLYVMSGDTNGPIGSDEFIAVNGVIALREGDVVGGVTLTSPAQVRALSVDNAGGIIHTWGYDALATETVFFACDSADVAGSSVALLTTGVDQLDLNGDGFGDGTVTDLQATNTVNDDALTDGGMVYLEVEIDDGTGPVEAMVRVPVSCCGNASLDAGEQCDDGNGDDTDACPGSCMFATCGDGYTWAGMEECDDGNPANTDSCLTTCVAATCGDGFLRAGVEECDDGNGDDTDICPGNCMVAECGDGYTWAGREECDDGNGDDTDACLTGCIAASCGDGIVHVGVEECDDADGDDTDECPGNCLDATCGDGFVQAGVEECDDGNDVDDDGCARDCTFDGSGTTTEPADSSGGDTTGPPGTTGDPEPGDTTAEPAESSTGTIPMGSSTEFEGSTGPTTGGPLGGLDDDGGCTCRSTHDRPSGGPPRALWGLLLMLLVRRRDGGR